MQFTGCTLKLRAVKLTLFLTFILHRKQQQVLPDVLRYLQGAFVCDHLHIQVPIFVKAPDELSHKTSSSFYFNFQSARAPSVVRITISTMGYTIFLNRTFKRKWIGYSQYQLVLQQLRFFFTDGSVTFCYFWTLQLHFLSDPYVT